jgi:hypothetical protein
MKPPNAEQRRAIAREAAKVKANQRELPITPSQANLLQNLQGEIAAAQARRGTAFSAIIGQYDIERAQVVGIAGTPEKPTLVIRLEPTEG